MTSAFCALLAASLGLSAGAAPTLVPQPQSLQVTGGYCPTSAVIRYETDRSIAAEGYRLDVSPEGILVRSPDAAGRLYARMTLEQMKGKDGYPCVRIEDRPAFRWRGLLIDESRHFFGKEAILQALELMAFHKLNVLHWHLTDDQGWRIDVPGLPELVKYGSVRPESPKRFAEFKEYDGYRYEAEMNGEPYGPFFYTEKDLREVVARAKELNITVVPEIDLPGHFRGALAAYPELCCFPENISPRAARSLWGISTDVLCVGNDKSVVLIEKILDYVCDVFPSEVIHIGGDECPRLNWEKCPKCRARMKAEGMKTPGELQDWITRRAISVLARRGRRAMGWDEMLGSGDLPRTVVGQSWRGAADEGVEIELVNGATGAKRGYDMVVNPHRECYYNYKQGLSDDPYPYSGHTVTLKTAYSFDPLKGVPSDCRAHILGSEACLWSEFITTADELAWKTWPRTCAMAEVLWTGAAKGVYADFVRRLAEHRRRLVRRGVNCAPVEMPVGKLAGGPVKVVFDTDMFTDFDDAGALACLHAYADAGQCEILATISCTRGCYSVAVCEVINAFYGRPGIPVGCTREIEISRHGLVPRHVFRYEETVKKYAKWVKHPISDGAPDANEVYRRVLAVQPDASVVICSVGFFTNLRRLLETKPDAISPMDGRTLVAKKVRKLVSMACRHPTGWEYNSGTDGASSKIVLEQWPTPIVYADWNLGIDLFAGRAVADAGTEDNPVADIFARSLNDPAALKGKPEHGWGKAGRAAWDEAAVLVAVEGEEKYFNVERGSYRIVDDQGNDVWTSDPHGRDCRVTEKVSKAEVGKVIDELMRRDPRRSTQRSEIRLGTPFADGMVLQRGMKVPIWGVAAPGESVSVSFSGQVKSTTADAAGAWRVDLDPLEASREGRDLVIRSGRSDDQAVLHDVLVGEVWFVSGQSNAELPMWEVSPRFRDRNGALVAQMTDKPLVRMCYASNYRTCATPRMMATYPVVWEKFDRKSLGTGHSFSAMGAYYALELYLALEVPIGVVGSYWGGTCIEPWIPAEGFASVGLDPAKCVPRPDAQQQPSVLWNEMVNPWAPMAMRGFIWYQGCSNSNRPELYCQRMHALYNGWAEKFENPGLRLYFVQLAPWEGGGHPEFQQAQAKFEAEEPNAGMAIINDLGNLTDIHPNEKATVAKRLAVHALKRDYGFESIRDNSPVLRDWEVEKDRVVMSFDNAKDLYIYNPDYCSPSNGFEICGADGVWKPARIANLRERIRHGVSRFLGDINGNRIALFTEEVGVPRGVRYLYSRPWYGSIYNEVNLPLGSFVLDLTQDPLLKPLDLQEKIDAAAAAGGGTVTVEPGNWETRPFQLKSHVALEIKDGAVLYASTNLLDYSAREGERTFVSAVDAEDVRIFGAGILDGRGFAFRERATGMRSESQPQALPVMMRFTRCRNLKLEGFTYRRGGAWGCHLRNCDGVTVRGVMCFNHVNNTNDGIDIESSNVVIEGCDIDADDDAVVFKAESDVNFPVTNVVVRNCRLASCCNALKFGTGSYCDFRDVRIEDCAFVRPNGNFRFDRSRHTGRPDRLSGSGGLALEVCDGGRMENVVIRNVTIEGYLTPVFVRLERRHGPQPGRETYLRNILIENVRGWADSRIASSITGVPGLRPQNIVIRNCDFLFPGGGTAADATASVPELEDGYPDCHMFGTNLPAWAFYVRHAEDVRFENVTCRTLEPDAREQFVYEDVDR